MGEGVSGVRGAGARAVVAYPAAEAAVLEVDCAVEGPPGLGEEGGGEDGVRRGAPGGVGRSVGGMVAHR